MQQTIVTPFLRTEILVYNRESQLYRDCSWSSVSSSFFSRGSCSLMNVWYFSNWDIQECWKQWESDNQATVLNLTSRYFCTPGLPSFLSPEKATWLIKTILRIPTIFFQGLRNNPSFPYGRNHLAMSQYHEVNHLP